MYLIVNNNLKYLSWDGRLVRRLSAREYDELWKADRDSAYAAVQYNDEFAVLDMDQGGIVVSTHEPEE